jgi:hypothetical protein
MSYFNFHGLCAQIELPFPVNLFLALNFPLLNPFTFHIDAVCVLKPAGIKPFAAYTKGQKRF